MVENEGRPRLRSLLNEVQSQGWLNAAVVYGYFPCVSDGNDLVILHHEGPDKGKERTRFSFPRQRRDRRLCLSDFFADKDSGKTDVVAFHVVTMGSVVSEAAAKLFAESHQIVPGFSIRVTAVRVTHSGIQPALILNSKFNSVNFLNRVALVWSSRKSSNCILSNLPPQSSFTILKQNTSTRIKV
jgi:hypothetical protein